MGITYSGNQGGRGYRTDPKRKSAEELAKNPLTGSHKLKLRLLEDGIKEHKCECCGLTEWNGKPIPLELHHKDGNHYNNDLTNLEVLCPNCHAQTDNCSCKNVRMNNLPIIRYSVAEVRNCLNIVEGIRRGITRDICGEELIGLLPY